MTNWRLLEGDCRDVLPALAAGSIDCVVTSPPYAMQRASCYASVPEADYPAWTVAWLSALRPALTPTGSVLLNIREHVKDGAISDYVHRTRLAVRAAGWVEVDELIWHKPDAPPAGHTGRPRRSWERILWFSPSRRPWCDPKANGTPSRRIGMGDAGPLYTASDGYQAGVARCTDVVSVPVGVTSGTAAGHPAAYPPALAAWLIRLCCPPGGMVCDPFAGSGSTGLAALAEGRAFVGVERDPRYAAMGRARLAASDMTRLAGAA